MPTSLFSNIPYRVADIHSAKIGREEINWVEREMPGLMAIRQKYENKYPLKGMRISGSSHITTHTAVFIETLKLLGAEVRWSASNIYSTQDQAAAAIAAHNTPIFAGRGESLSDYWWSIFQTLHFSNHQGPTHIIDDKGDLSIMIHQGLMGENNYKVLDQESNVFSINELNLFLKRVLAEDQNCWKNLTKDLKVITEDTKTGINRMLQLLNENRLLYPIIDINSSIIKSKIDNFYSCKGTIAESIKKATRTMLIGKDVVICGFGDIGRGCAEALRNSGARVSITETDPIRAMGAAMEGYQVVKLNDVCETADIFITATGRKHILKFEHMQRMKDQAIICNMGHYELEIEYDVLNTHPEIKKIPISPQLKRYFFPDGNSILLIAEGKLVNLACDTTQMAFLKSCSYSTQTLIQIELNKIQPEIGIHKVPKDIDTEVSILHLPKIGAKLTFTNKNKLNQ